MSNFLLLISVLTSFVFSKPENKILVIGDSLTAGYGVAKSEAFPSQLQTLVTSKGHKYQVINAGTSGSTSASAVSRMRWHLKAKPKIIILALGANDGLRGFPIETTRKNLEKAIQLGKKESIKMYLAGMKLPKNYGEPYRTQFEKIFIELAKENKITLIPFLLEGVAGRPSLNLADGIHPNEEGHKMIAKTVLAAIGADL